MKSVPNYKKISNLLKENLEKNFDIDIELISSTVGERMSTFQSLLINKDEVEVYSVTFPFSRESMLYPQIDFNWTEDVLKSDYPNCYSNVVFARDAYAYSFAIAFPKGTPGRERERSKILKVGGTLCSANDNYNKKQGHYLAMKDLASRLTDPRPIKFTNWDELFSIFEWTKLKSYYRRELN